MTKPVWTYAFIAYLITWSITLSIYFLYKHGFITLDELNLLFNFGAIGPFVGAIVAARIFYKREGVRALFRSLRFTSLGTKPWLLSFSPLLFGAIGWLAYPLLTGHWFSFEETRRQFHLTSDLSYVSWILPFITYAVFEEFGWRGFLLPHLQQKYSALKATAILTAIWACWHLPFFLWRFQFSAFIAVGFFFSIFVGAVIITSTYNLSRGCLVPVMLFHLTNNIASALDKEYIVAVVSVAFVLLAVYLIWRYKAENLADLPRVQNFYVTAPRKDRRGHS